MDPDRWRRIEELCHAAAAREGAERAAFLDQACGDDLELRQEIESLLAEQTGAEQFLETPALQAAALTPGTRLSHYEIEALVGAGGMGEVYRARDTTLDRVVALKVLPAAVAHDASRRLRFEREAKAVAALNHPNIVTIHSVEQAEGLHFLTMELVGGETVRERTPKQGLALDALLDVAIPLADAVSTAHEAGIVHRDLKPDNVMLTPEGRVKVLDFGLAKLRPVVAGSERTTMPASAETDAGRIVGTVAYMAPEQAEGKAVDARTDVFAIGVMLYEMATGERPFTGETGVAVMSAILRHTPPRVTDLRPELPRDLAKIVQRCLAKDPERRYQTAKDIRNELTELKEDLASGEAFAPTGVAPVAVSRSRSARPLRAVAIAVGAVAVAVVLWWGLTSRPEVSTPPMQTSLLTSYPGPEGAPALSPDGELVAFTWRGPSGEGPVKLFVKQVGGGEPREIHAGAGDVHSPTWSPDGREIAFLQDVAAAQGEPSDGLFVIPYLGGEDAKRLDVFRGRSSLSWSPDGSEIAIAHRDSPDTPFRIYLVSVETGDHEPVTSPPAAHADGDSQPRFSHDGRALAFVRGDRPYTSDIYLMELPEGEPKRITTGNGYTTGLDWTSDGRRLVFSATRCGRAESWRLWSVSAVPGAEPEPLGVGEDGRSPRLSRTGDRLVYVQSDLRVWITRIGGPMAADDDRGLAEFAPTTVYQLGPVYSPDGQRVAFIAYRSGCPEVWVAAADGSRPQQLTFLEAPIAGVAAWSPDGSKLAFFSNQDANRDIYTVNVDSGFTTRLTSDSADERPFDWSKDGRWIYYTRRTTGRSEIYRLPAGGDGEPEQLTRNGGGEVRESPDGRDLYFTRTHGGDAYRPAGLWRMPRDGGQETLVLPQVRPWHWAMIDAGICYFDEDSNPPAIKFFDFSTGETSVVVAPPAVLPKNPSFTLSPDGRWLLYASNSDERNIVLVENFR